jgi:hypothetical protein
MRWGQRTLHQRFDLSGSGQIHLVFPSRWFRTCDGREWHDMLDSIRGLARMKGTCKVAHLVFSILLDLGFSIPRTADTIYLSTFNLSTIDKFDSSGNGTDFATASPGLNYPLGLAFDSSSQHYEDVETKLLQ